MVNMWAIKNMLCETVRETYVSQKSARQIIAFFFFTIFLLMLGISFLNHNSYLKKKVILFRQKSRHATTTRFTPDFHTT